MSLMLFIPFSVNSNDSTATWPSWSIPSLWLSLCVRSNKEIEVLETVSSAISDQPDKTEVTKGIILLFKL